MGSPALRPSQHRHAGWGPCSRLHSEHSNASPQELGTPRVEETKRGKHTPEKWLAKNEPGGKATLVSEGNGVTPWGFQSQGQFAEKPQERREGLGEGLIGDGAAWRAREGPHARACRG